ncbi:hypothetical protein [Candidatus Frankia alpina]|uniref:hypothetical protein n=1 Tax=Candidatus Frankia alpina TaxID=2699483 RepID=UPI001386A3D3|nr:hypothetical protein [Candidatus Frankia alpina]
MADPEQVLQALTEASAAVRAAAELRPDLAAAAEVAANEFAAARLDLVSWTALRGRGPPRCSPGCCSGSEGPRRSPSSLSSSRT